MSFGDLLQNLVAGGAFILGVIYLIGGLIVNLNLTHRGVVEYQILKVKYLAVGVIFLFQFLGVVVFTSIPFVLLATVSMDERFVRAISIPSILASLVLLLVWSRYPPNTKSVVGRWWFWFGMSVLGTLFPMLVFFHALFFPHGGFQWVFNNILGVLSGLLTIMAQIYHYSSFYYGQPSALGALDHIGMGIPARVNLVCDSEIAAGLQELELPIQKNIIRDVFLIDETDAHYIIGLERVPGGAQNNKTYKINKNLVKVIMHNPDHMRKLSMEEIGQKNTKDK